VQDSRPEVGRAQREEFSVGVERARIVVPREGPGCENHVRVADQQHAERGQQQLRKCCQVRRRRSGQPRRDRADHGDPVPVEPEDRHGRRGEDQGNQGAGKCAPQARQGEEEGKDGSGQAHRRPVGLRHMLEEGDQLRGVEQ
jgi:hypothetical protein